MVFNFFELKRASKADPKILNDLLQMLNIDRKFHVNREPSDIEIDEILEEIDDSVKKALNTANISYMLRSILKASGLPFEEKTITEMIYDIVNNEQRIKQSFKY